MVASKLHKYWGKTDKFGCKVSEWAEETSKAGRAKCKYCVNCEIIYKKGCGPLITHSESSKHRNNVPSKASSSENVQISIEKAFNLDKANEEKAKSEELGISLNRWASRHNVPFSSLECLSDILKKYSDDKVVQLLKLSKTKCEYVAAHGIGEFYLQDIIEKVKESDAISIGFDESAMNKREECEIVVKYSHPIHGVQTSHFKTIELDQGDAEYIVNMILEAFEGEAIDFEKKLVSVTTDGAAVMTGNKSGVHKRLATKFTSLEFLTSCLDHHTSNSMQKGTTEFDPDLEPAMVNLYEDLSGSKGRSLKKRHDFHKTAENVGIVPMEIPKMSTTRFRAIGSCVRSALHNLPIYREYYSNLQKLTPRQKLLKVYFVDQGILTELKLQFIKYAIAEMESAINFFEESTDNFHLIYERMEKLLRNQLSQFINNKIMEMVDEEGNIEKVSGQELLNIDVDKKEDYKKRKYLKIGEGCSELLKKLELDPDSPQIKSFMDSVLKFHKTVSRQFIKYFEAGLSSKVLNYASSLSPSNHSKCTTKRKILYLAKKYKRVVENIDKASGMDTLEREIEDYIIDDDLKDMKDQNYRQYWNNVKQMTENGWLKYKVLPRFAFAMSTILNSNSECERMFSHQTRLSRNPDRNRMSQKKFESHMSIRSSVESFESFKVCEKCEKIEQKLEVGIETKYSHCHCLVAPVPESMKELCRNSWRKDRAVRQERLEKSRLEESLFVSRKRKFDEQNDKDFQKLKSKMLKRNTLLPPNKMLQVWKKKESSSSSGGDANKNKK